MVPYAQDPTTAMALASVYSQERRAEAEADCMIRSAVQRRRAERRRASAEDAPGTRHWFSWPRMRAAAAASELSPRSS